MTVDDVSQPNVGVLMFVAYRAMEQEIYAAMSAGGFAGTLAQGRLFARIGETGTRLTELAEMAQVTKQTAGFLVDQLERLGYVERVPDPTDGRARLVRISARGRQAQASARVVEDEVLTRWTEHLGESDMVRLAEILARLRTVTDPWADRDPPST